jgi:hypothetical protein
MALVRAWAHIFWVKLCLIDRGATPYTMETKAHLPALLWASCVRVMQSVTCLPMNRSLSLGIWDEKG